MEEERRLCYVAITRAKKKLTISYAKQRMLYGRTSASLPSRFLTEIPADIVERKGSVVAYTPSYNTNQIPKPATSYYKTEVAKSKPAGTYLELNKGDMVLHSAFGKGMVLSVMKMGGDALWEIAFDTIGTKKLMAKTASVQIKKM